MNNEKINALVQSYVDELFAHDDMSDQENIEDKNDAFVTCRAFVGHILETHCIVEKSEVRETLEELKEDARPVCEWDEKVVDVVTLEDTFIYLFGKELFNTTEK